MEAISNRCTHTSVFFTVACRDMLTLRRVFQEDTGGLGDWSAISLLSWTLPRIAMQIHGADMPHPL